MTPTYGLFDFSGADDGERKQNLERGVDIHVSNADFSFACKAEVTSQAAATSHILDAAASASANLTSPAPSTAKTSESPRSGRKGRKGRNRRKSRNGLSQSSGHRSQASSFDCQSRERRHSRSLSPQHDDNAHACAKCRLSFPITISVLVAGLKVLNKIARAAPFGAHRWPYCRFHLLAVFVLLFHV